MKKMVCEICESQKIKKEKGVFVCQDCGTEYSLEEAKKLLCDVETLKEDDIDTKEENKINNDKNKILEYLSIWLKCISPLEDTVFWTGNDFFDVLKKDGQIKPVTNDKVYQIVNTKFKTIGSPTDEDFYSYCSNVSKYNQFYSGKYPCELLEERLKYNTYIGKTISKICEYRRVEPLTDYLGRKEYRDFFVSTDGTIKECMHDIVDEIRFLTKIALTGKTFKVETKQPRLFFGTYWADNTKFFDLTNTFKVLRDFISEFRTRHAELLKLYNENFEEVINSYKEIQNAIIEIEKVFFLPEKYRNSSVIMCFIDLLMTGRADSWKEAVNIYEAERRMDLMIIALNNIDTKLSSINQTLTNISHSLSNISLQMDGIYTKLSIMNKKVGQIMYDTRFNLIWN